MAMTTNPSRMLRLLPFVPLTLTLTLMLSTHSAAAHQPPPAESSQEAGGGEGDSPSLSQPLPARSSGCDQSSVLMAVIQQQQAMAQQQQTMAQQQLAMASQQQAMFQQLIQQQSSRIERLETGVKEQESKNERLETELSRVEGVLASYENQQASTNRRVQEDLATLRTDSQPVAFTVRLSKAKDNGGKGMALAHLQTLVFDDVITNLGHAYDPRNGIFTAPANGTYVFSLSIMSASLDPYLFVAVVKNGNVLDQVYAEGRGDNNDQGSSLVTTQLTTGDHVSVRQNHGNAAVRGDFWTVFSGFRLR